MAEIRDPSFAERAVEELRKEFGTVHTAKRVLLVEDDDDDALLMQHRLESVTLGFQVKRVSTGEAAMEALENEPFDIAIIDLMLPRMKGDALLHQLRERWPQIHAIVVSGYLDQAAFRGLFSSGIRVTLVPKGVLEMANKKVAEAIGLK